MHMCQNAIIISVRLIDISKKSIKVETITAGVRNNNSWG